MRASDDQERDGAYLSGMRDEDNRRYSSPAPHNRGRYHEDLAMNDKRISTICSKCGKRFEQKDPLPLCPECLFGIEDIGGAHKPKYPSALSNHRASGLSPFGPSTAAAGR